MPIYAITGANGRLGHLVLTYLLNQIPAKQIIATTRHPEQLADYSAQGVVVRLADFNDPLNLPAAFSGATRLFIIGTNEYPMEKRFFQTRTAIAAAVRAGIHYITTTALPDAANKDDENPWTRGSRQTMEALAQSGVEWTALCMNVWMAGVPFFLNALHIGEQLLVPEGSGKPCWITHEDYARTAVSILTGKTSLNGSIHVTGPESLGLEDLAQRWSDLHMRKLEAQVLPEKEVIERLVSNGMPLQSSQRIVGNCGIMRLFEVPISDTVERATEIPPTSVDGLLRDLVIA